MPCKTSFTGWQVHITPLRRRTGIHNIVQETGMHRPLRKDPPPKKQQLMQDNRLHWTHDCMCRSSKASITGTLCTALWGIAAAATAHSCCLDVVVDMPYYAAALPVDSTGMPTQTPSLNQRPDLKPAAQGRGARLHLPVNCLPAGIHATWDKTTQHIGCDTSSTPGVAFAAATMVYVSCRNNQHESSSMAIVVTLPMCTSACLPACLLDSFYCFCCCSACIVCLSG